MGFVSDFLCFQEISEVFQKQKLFKPLKMRKQKQYKQKFRKQWLRNEMFKNWLMEVSNNPHTAYRKFCICEINAKYSDLIGHLNAKKHMKSNPLILKTIPITEFCKPKCQEISKLEGNIAMFMSCQCATMNCDHLVDLCKNTIDDSKIASKLKIHRTKCSGITV